MKHRSEKFTIGIRDSKHPEVREFTAGRDFRLRHDAISHDLMLDLPTRIIDLLRIASSVYFVDRISKRQRNGGPDRWPRRFSCSIEVTDAAFWNQETVNNLVKDALQFVSGDTWELEFTQDAHSAPTHDYLPFGTGSCFDTPPIVCLYSGGLDSASGLARRLGDGIDAPLIPVVVRHRTDIARKTTKQIERLGACIRYRASTDMCRHVDDRTTATRPLRRI